MLDAKGFIYSTWWQEPFIVEAKSSLAVGEVPLPVRFLTNVVSGPPTKPVFYKWDFDGDGTFEFSSGKSPDTNHVFDSIGTYTVTVKATDIYGNFETDSVDIDVTQSIVVEAIADPDRGYAPLSVNLSAEVTGANLIISYKWDFDGDGTFDYESQTSPDVANTYNSEGVFPATIMVTDDWGGTASDTVEIITKPPLSVVASVVPDKGYAPLNVDLMAEVTGGSTIVSYEWDFESDGTYDYTSADIAEVTHEYPTADMYTATIRVTDDWGGTATDSVGINVGVPITIDLSADKTPVYVFDAIAFQATASGGFPPVSFEWDFNNDGIFEFSSGNVPNANRVQKFDSEGNYITQWGCYGTGDGLFHSIADVAVDSNGKVYVTDTGYVNVVDDLSIQKFAPLDGVSASPPFMDFASALPVKPEKTVLLQNFPNPFNPETWIPFQLKEDCDVKIQIYDISGRLVRRLNLGYKSAGLYTSQSKSAYWDGNNEYGEKVSSGIYFYTITAGNFSSVKKMIAKK